MCNNCNVLGGIACAGVYDWINYVVDRLGAPHYAWINYVGARLGAPHDQ